ncbi:MAG: ABC transporter permease [Gemmatimonadaceae bacterium]
MTKPSLSNRFFKFWRVKPETEVDDEIAAHIELQTQRFIASGKSEADARALALSRFGNTNEVRAECTDIRQRLETKVRRTEYFAELSQDLHFAFRSLRKSRVFTVVALLTIAIGVGANTAIFSVIDAVLLRSSPYANAERSMVLFNSYEQEGLNKTPLSAPELFDFRDGFQSMDAIAAIRPTPATTIGNGADPEQLTAYAVTPNLFDVLGVSAARGRTFRADEGALNGALFVILSDALWKRRFGADTSIVGKTITINAQQRQVVGVMPPGIRFPDDPIGYASGPADIWIPWTYEESRTANRGNQNLIAIGRLKAGASASAVTRDIADISRHFKADFPERYAGQRANNWHIQALSLHDETVGAIRPVLLLFGGAVGFVLLIACVNVANLLIARGATRKREMAVRLALGAGRSRLLRQLLTESLVLSICGGILGVVLAWVGVKLITILNPTSIPRVGLASVNWTVLIFSLGLSLVTGLLIGLFPALQQSRTGLAGALSDGSRGASDGRGRKHLRGVLVVAEVAMALVLLNGAGLLGRSFAALQRVDTGFSAHNVMTMYTSVPRSRYDSSGKIARFYSQLDERLAATPGVVVASGVYPLPMVNDGWSGSFDIEGVPKSVTEQPHAEFAVAMPAYFTAMGIKVVEGRDFIGDDNLAHPHVAIVDEELARKHWPHESAIGKRVNALEKEGEFATIVGVVRHVRATRPENDGGPQIYMSYLQHPQGMLYPVVRSTLSPVAMMNFMRSAVKSVDENIPVSKLQSMEAITASALSRQRFNMLMIATLAIVALILASVGLYGVMSSLVTQRSREIGIRMALGGQPNDVRWLVVRESLWICVIGLIVGTGATLATSHALKSMLFGIAVTDPVTYTSIAALLFAVSCVAAYGPARRATRVAPLVALRD